MLHGHYLTFSSVEHIIFISERVSVVPVTLATSTTAVSSFRPTCEMRFSEKLRTKFSNVAKKRKFISPCHARAGNGYCTWSVVCVCVCLSVRKSVSTVFLDNRGSSELQTWIYFQVGCLDGKLRLWSGEAQGRRRADTLPPF